MRGERFSSRQIAFWTRIPLVVRPCLAPTGRFPFNKNSGLKFRKFYVPNGTVHSGCADPTFGYCFFFVSRIQKSGTGQWWMDTDLSKGEPGGAFMQTLI